MVELLEQYSSDIYLSFEDAVMEDDTTSFLNSLNVKGRIADIGSGTSYYLDFLGGHWQEYIGIEPNNQMRMHALESAALERRRCQFLTGRAQCIPLDDCSVDVVMSTYAINEVGAFEQGSVAQHVAKSLAEMKRIAKPNAQIVIIDLTGGENDGWYKLLNVAAVARGGQPLKEMVDVWIEVFSFLQQHAVIESVSRLSMHYEFDGLDDALYRCQALVPDMFSNDVVRDAVIAFLGDGITLAPEGLGVVARLKS